MEKVNLSPSFFVPKHVRRTTTAQSCSFDYKNEEATLLIDGELDLADGHNDVVLQADKILITPRGSVTANNITFIASTVVIYGEIKAKKNLSIDASTLSVISSQKYGFFKLVDQITSYDDAEIVQDRIMRANNI